jgi:CheY-like chemotaxis protein
MTPESQSRVLKAFEQADVSINRRFGGTGLGLAISTRILEKFGSKLEISSIAGKGSTFSFDIDLSSGSSNHLSVEEIKDLNVLIADDHDVARDALESIVNAIGWRSEIFNGGLPAYHRALKANSPDLILLDWDMPDMDGLTVARLIKSEQLRSSSPIIVMVTALGSEEVRNSADSIYVDAVLDKPVTASALLDAVMSIHKPTTAKSDESENHLAGLKLLVVDDNEFNRQVAVEIFSVDDGHEAVEFLANNDHSIDLVLMDIQMPIMDGYEATRKIRQELKLTDLPIIALTAGAFAQDKEKALQSGMNDFIPKPLDVKRSVALIQRYTQGGLELSPKQPSANAAGQAANRILDLEGALTIWRSEEKLNTYLKKFFDEYKTFVSRFARMSDIEREVHKLKGAAGALGLKRLFATTSSLLDSLRSRGTPNAQKINEFADVLRATLSHIESRCNIKVVSDDPLDLSIEQQLEIIERAQSLLEDNNPAPILGELVTLTGIVDDVLLSKATDALEAFDFVTAKEQINTLKAAVIANNQMGE